MITIETLKQDDMPQLIELYKELVPPHIEFNASLERCLKTYETMEKDDRSFLAVAKEKGEIVGSALGICCQCLVNPFLVVEDVIVRSDQRGKGVGRMLMEALDQFAQEKGCAYSFLVSSDFRTGAHSFYESMGYTDGVVGFRKIYNK